MSSVIDERVVQMSFDNDQFEKGVSQTINSLNKLDKTLVDTADGEYFTKMEERIQKVEQTFSKSGMVINGILIGIGQTINQYINKGLATLTSGIRSGMQEYETQMGATQTILANVKDEGKGIDDVTAALDELNTYADKTIYNFTEMTRNIGMFTAAGANLDTSVATIKGLANAAALVGANATTAARAWYQVSQAMAAGSFKLMDWRSLEISNIAGEGFKSVLTEVARKDGLAVAKMIDNGTALRDTLKDGWLTAERFSEAMEILTGEWEKEDYLAHGYTQEQYEMLSALAQEAVNAAIKVKTFGQLMETTAEAIGSGWAVTFRTIIGDFEKAKTFFTRVSVALNSVIDKIADYRNHFLDFIWNTDSGNGIGSVYDNFKETIDNILAIFSTFVGAMRAGFHNIFNWSEIRDNLGKFSKATNDITRQFVLNTYRDVTLAEENEQRAAEGLAKLEANEMNKPNTWDLDAVNDNINKLIRIFRGLFAGIDVVLRTIGDTIGWLLEQIPGIGDFYKNLKDGNLSLLDNLANIADKITMVRDMIVDLNLVPNILNLIKQSIIDFIKNSPILMGLIGAVDYAIRVVKAFISTLKDLNISPFNILLGALKLIAGAIGAIIYGISEAINKVIQFISGNVNFSFLDSIGQEIMVFIVLLGELGKGTISVADIFDYYKQKVIKAFESIMRSPFVEGFIKFFTNAWNNIKTFWNNVINVFTSAGDQIEGFFTKYFGDFEFDIKDLGLFGVLAAIGVLLYKFTRDVEGWVSIGSRLADVLNAFANKVNSEALLNLAYAVGILAASIFVLSFIPYETLMNTVSMITAVMLMFIALFSVIKVTFDSLEKVKEAVKPLEKMGLNLSKGLQRFVQRAGSALLLEAIGDALIKITVAIVGLAVAFKFLPKEMEQAIGVITVVGIALGALAIALSYITGKNGISGAAGLISFSDLLKQGIVSFLGAMSQAAKMAAIALVIEAFADAIIKISAAILILSYAAKDPAAFWQGVGALLIIGGALAGVYKLIQKSIMQMNVGVFVGLSIVLLAFAGSVAVLSVVASILGPMPWQQLLAGVLSVGGIMVALGFAIRLATKFINADTAGVFMTLAAVFLSLGVGIAAVVYTSTLIQNGFQIAALSVAVGGMIALIGEMIGLVAVLKTLNVDYKVILSLSAIIGTMSLAFISIGVALNQLNDVHVSPSALLTVAAMMVVLQLVLSEAIGLGILAAVAEAVIPGVGYVAAAAIGAIAAMILSFGVTVYLLSLAILNIQEALSNFFDVLIFLSTQGEYFISTIKGAGETIVKAVPSLFGLFMSIGIALGTVISAILIGVYAMLDSIVLQACTMILQIIVLVSDWVNNNAGLILNALSVLWDAILNLAAVTLIFSIEKVLPILLSTLLTLPVRLWGMVISALGDLLKNSGVPVLELIGETFSVAGEAAIWLADTVTGAINTIITGLQALGIEIDSIGGGSQEMTYAVSDAALSAADAVNKATASITENNTKLVDVNTAATQKLEENSKKYSETKKAEANAVNFYNQMESDSTANAIGSMISITDEGLKINTDAIKDSFNLTLDNQGSMIESYLGNVDYLGVSSNGKTKNYLDTNTDLYNDYFGRLSEAEQEWYTKMEEGAKLQKAGDYAGGAKLFEEARDLMKESDFTWDDILHDNVDFDTKGLFESIKPSKAVFDSWEGLGNAISDYMANYKSAEVDTSMYSPDFGSSSSGTSSGTDTSKLQEELKNRNDAINKADSEIHPKDLTPTIDLDQLKSEVNQANGIMTGSLLAAQNAAIGDYINTDSELNPFLKDRWQNTYNFTQNNYSPKALSRIDIYRQTQNQLRLSRGM